MPLPHHLIDGYNLLHAAGFARATYGPGDLQRARVKLLVRIADGLSDECRERTTIVFDAADPPPDAASRTRFREMTVLFSVETGEADALIEELIRRHPAPRQLRVVSDDIRLQKAAKRRGAQAVKCDPFLDRLARRSAAGRSPHDPQGREGRITDDAPDLADWLRFFNLTDSDLQETTWNAPSGPLSKITEKPSAHQPADALLPRPAEPPTARPASRDRAPLTPDPPVEPEPAADDLAFWQRRIDELMAEERSKDVDPPAGR